MGIRPERHGIALLSFPTFPFLAFRALHCFTSLHYGLVALQKETQLLEGGSKGVSEFRRVLIWGNGHGIGMGFGVMSLHFILLTFLPSSLLYIFAEFLSNFCFGFVLAVWLTMRVVYFR